jgi:phage-related baseplate assembly protein
VAREAAGAVGEGAVVAVREVVAGERLRPLTQRVEARATKKGTARTSSAPSLLPACSTLSAGQELCGC